MNSRYIGERYHSLIQYNMKSVSQSELTDNVLLRRI